MDTEHARLEGERDLSLAHWREVHERCFTDIATDDHGFTPGMPIVLERFRVVYQALRPRQRTAVATSSTISGGRASRDTCARIPPTGTLPLLPKRSLTTDDTGK